MKNRHLLHHGHDSAEAAEILEDGIALRAVDVDAVMLLWLRLSPPPWRALHLADVTGAATLCDRITDYATQDAHFWPMPPLLTRLAQSGGRFADL